MRSLTEWEELGALSSEIFSALQVGTIKKPLLLNLRTLRLFYIGGGFIPFIPFILSPRTTVIDIKFSGYNLPTAMVASTLMTLPALCPNLEKIILQSLPRDPAIVAGVSGMLLATNRNTLRCFRVGSPLTEEAQEVIYNLPNLRELSAIIERDTSLPSAVLPNLTSLAIECDHGYDWLRMFHGATLERLESVIFDSRSEQIGDFLGAFKRVALAASTQNTLSRFTLHISCSWNPSYTSLLPFTQMTCLVIEFSCGNDCSSSVDDDIITSLARAMPKLQYLSLGDEPCRRITTGVTVKGLMVLAHHCPNLFVLRVHFQVASLSAPPATPGTTSNAGSTSPWWDCALAILEVGKIPVPGGGEVSVHGCPDPSPHFPAHTKYRMRRR